MTLSAHALWLYALALFGLWITPGPVFVALTARALAGGFANSWPLAVGVALGDIFWSLLAIFGLTWVVGQFAGLMVALHWLAALMFLGMGVMLWRKPGAVARADSRLTRPGLWAAFTTGIIAVIGNPKAILFYMSVLPGFVDLRRVTGPDIAVICALSAAIPLAGNLFNCALVGALRHAVATPERMSLINRVAGALLVAVGLAIAAMAWAAHS